MNYCVNFIQLEPYSQHIIASIDHNTPVFDINIKVDYIMVLDNLINWDIETNGAGNFCITDATKTQTYTAKGEQALSINLQANLEREILFIKPTITEYSDR